MVVLFLAASLDGFSLPSSGGDGKFLAVKFSVRMVLWLCLGMGAGVSCERSLFS